MLTRTRYRVVALRRYRPLATQEVGDVHPQRMSNQEQVRESRIPAAVFVPLDTPAFQAGEVRELLL